MQLQFDQSAVQVAAGRGCPTGYPPLLVADSPHSNTIDDRIAKPAPGARGPGCRRRFHAHFVVADSPNRLPFDAAIPVCLPLDAGLFPHNVASASVCTPESTTPTIYVAFCLL